LRLAEELFRVNMSGQGRIPFRKVKGGNVPEEDEKKPLGEKKQPLAEKRATPDQVLVCSSGGARGDGGVCFAAFFFVKRAFFLLVLVC
jgi:hypothetical protein